MGLRLFVALELPAATRQRLAERVRRARGDAPPARWVRREAMHVTLAFLGSVDGEWLPRIERALTPAFAGHRRVDASVGGDLGTFPPRGKARVLWADVRTRDATHGADTSKPLTSLQRSVADALAALEAMDGTRLYTPEPRPYRPHVTLGRCRTPWARGVVTRFTTAAAGPPLPMPVHRGVLMQSHLEPRGARYEIVSTYPLASPSGDAGLRRVEGGDR
ncbi:MAG: RNA 2',3'-cyclic phosphodiesterase [Acidobacteriota bacterium]